jgi:hypothetical protein
MRRTIPRPSKDPSLSPAGRPRTGSVPRQRLRRPSLLCWPIVVVLALLLSACQLRQETRFNPDGSGTATATVGIDKTCESPDEECAPEVGGVQRDRLEFMGR